jgi:hypothetical protein
MRKDSGPILVSLQPLSTHNVLKQDRIGFYHFTDPIYTAPAREAIGIEEIPFTSGVWIDENGTFHLREHPGIPQYVGPPSVEIDKEWDLIIERELSWSSFTEKYILSICSGMVSCYSG